MRSLKKMEREGDNEQIVGGKNKNGTIENWGKEEPNKVRWMENYRNEKREQDE